MSANVNQPTTIKTVQRWLISVHNAVAVEMNSVVTHAVTSVTHLYVVYIILVIRKKQTNQFEQLENTQRV